MQPALVPLSHVDADADGDEAEGGVCRCKAELDEASMAELRELRESEVTSTSMAESGRISRSNSGPRRVMTRSPYSSIQ